MFLGISSYNHESAVALINRSGILIDYCKEESLSRIKGDKSFPKRALRRIIEINHLNLDNICNIIFYEKPLSAFLFPLKTASSYLPKSLSFIAHQLRNFNNSSISCFTDLAKFSPGLEKKLTYIDHHLAHTLTALPYSKRQEDLCSIVVDGFGDRSTASISYIKNMHCIKELWSSDYPHSLGLFFSSITDFLGFNVNEGEYKVMGLSSFGNSNSEYAKLVYKLINWDKTKNNIVVDLDYFSYHISITNSFNDKLIELLGEPRNPFKKLLPADENFQKYADIARGAQDVTNFILSEIFAHAYKLTNTNSFLFSGGVALNSASLNTLANLHFTKDIIVPPSPGDCGAAIGSAIYAFIKSNPTNSIIEKPSLFPSKFIIENEKVKVKNIINDNFSIISKDKLESLKICSDLILEGQVLGLLLSNSETGPRALGNRSLICNGLNLEAVTYLNTVLKNRSPFRPTAPAMKINAAEKYYELKTELYQSYFSMNATCNCLHPKAINFPITHIDGTARIQIVENGSILYDLLEILQPKGIEILANSSLNLSGDPTCFDLIDGLMFCSLSPLEYLLTDIGLIKKLV